jgi:3D (Asp-Asp-Asp) domain-containing protein
VDVRTKKLLLAPLAVVAAAIALAACDPTGTAVTAYGTLYGAYDNTPAGTTQIDFPKRQGYPTIHNSAGGSGTFADPLTMASDPRELPIGTKVYDSHLQRYFVMEDSCTECTADFNARAGNRFDMYVGNTSNTRAVLACEDSLTLDARNQPFVINPDNTGTVATTPLWSDATRHCYQPGVDK